MIFTRERNGFFFFFFNNLKHLMQGHICDPHVPVAIDRDAVRHVKETRSPAGQDLAGCRAQRDNGVR